MPYDHKNTTPDGYPYLRMRSMLEKLNHLHLEGRGLIGSGGGSVGFVLLALISCNICLNSESGHT